MFKKQSHIATLYLFIVVTSFCVLNRLGFILILPTDENLLNWDAYFFNRIRTVGYEYIPYTGTNLAFFPLFPFIWKMLGISSFWISAFNIGIFIVGFNLLTRTRRLPLWATLFILSIPSFIFFALPYSESLAFFFCVLIILGYDKSNTILKVIGYIGVSMVKVITIVFVPIIILSHILTKSNRSFNKADYFDCAISYIGTFGGLLVAVCFQAYQTGKWFYFIEIQQFWGRAWLIPQFPLTTTNAKNVLGIDAIAFVMGLFTIYLSCKWSLGWIRRLDYRDSVSPLDYATVFSTLYLASITLLDVLFTNASTGSTNIWSINRHFFCNPFFVLFLIWFLLSYKPSKNEVKFLFFLVTMGIYISGVYRHTNMLLLYVIFFSSLAVAKFFTRYYKFAILSILLTFYYQLTFYQDFLLYFWIG